MIDEKLKIFLLKENGVYNFKKLVHYMESTGIRFIVNKLTAPVGLTTIDRIYIDLDKLEKYNDKVIYYIILHEIGHYKRIQKYGSDWVIEMLSTSEFDSFCNHIITEEIFADRFSCFMFYYLNNKTYPWYGTQQLNLDDHQKYYKNKLKESSLFGNINNDYNKYYDLVNQIVIKQK